MFWRTAKLFCTMAVPFSFYIPTSKVMMIPVFPYAHQYLLFLFCFFLSIASNRYEVCLGGFALHFPNNYWGKDWRQEEKGMAEDEMVGWHHRLDGHEFGQALGVGDGQESLVCCSSWGRKESDTSEWLNWTELTEWLMILSIFSCVLFGHL